MNLTSKQLLGLPVETQSGQHLGRVHDFMLDPTHQTIVQYSVRAGVLPKELFGRELLVASEQVVLLTEEKMVVDDLTIGEVETAKSAAVSGQEITS